MQKIKLKSDENKIISWNIFFSIFIIILICVSIFYIYPEIVNIETLKQETKDLKKNLDKYKKEWITLDIFKEKVKTLNWEKTEADKNLINSVLKDIDNSFFEKNLKNTKEDNYNVFIKKKIEEYKKNKTNEEKLKTISKVLPYYSDNISDENTMTDFQFINYIESLMYAFNLNYNDEIGISEIKQIEDYTLNSTDASLDKGVYKIPVELNIIWRKSSIIDFLHFIENVWKVSIDEKTKEIIVNKGIEKPGELFYDLKNKKINWVRKDENYNIYDNQIADVENIFMKDYIDSSDRNLIYKTIDSKDFIKYLKSTQSNEKYEVKLKINFYVKGLPKYKIDEFTSWFNKKINDLKNDVIKSLSKINLSSSKKQKLQNIKLNIDNIKSIVDQDKSSKKTIAEKYQILSSYSKILDEYEQEIKQINL